jgi:mRNA interferase MazF
MIEAGDVVVALLPGARETKRRPAVVISTSAYQKLRPDVILAIITSRVEDAHTDFDCVLFDWRKAGLQTPCAMRSYLFTTE